MSKVKPDLSYIAPQLHSLAVPCDSLILDPANARTHNEKNLEAIKGSLAVYGQRKPIVAHVDTKVVEAGNGTLLAARSLGWKYVAVVFVEDDAATAAGYAISDNRTAELAGWDDETLKRLMVDIRTDCDERLDTMIADLANDRKLFEPDKDDDPAPDQTGDIGEEFRVLTECSSEQQQLELIDKLTSEGFTCRALTL